MLFVSQNFLLSLPPKREGVTSVNVGEVQNLPDVSTTPPQYFTEISTIKHKIYNLC
jgi:hypothetical protein